MPAAPSQAPGPPASRTRATVVGPARPRVPAGVARLWQREHEGHLTPAVLVTASASFLVAVGLVMVLSASTIESYTQTGSPFALAVKQALFAVVAVPLAVAAARVPVRWWRRLAWPAMLAALALQATVFTSRGVSVLGNRNWVDLGLVTVQPAEALKLALVIWVAHVLARKHHLIDRLGHLLIPLAPVALAALALVLAGRDVGSAVVIIAILAGMLLAAGVRARYLSVAGLVAATVVAVLVLQSANRMERVQSWVSGDSEYLGAGWQPTHGLWALASGGWWGVGLGASHQKWAWLPEAHNDFIFAIIGEELGLPGTLTVLFLFAVLVLGATRIALRSADRFVVIASGGIIAWLGGQAVLNIGVVLGLLPVTGVPLPLVSSGGSSLVTSMIAVGVLVSFTRADTRAEPARAEPARAGARKRARARTRS